LILNFLLVVFALSALQSCVSKKKYDELTAAKEATDAALAETQTKVQSLEEQNADLESTLESEKERLNGEIAGIRSDLDATKSQMASVESKLNMTQKELEDLKAEINGIFGAYEDSGLSLKEMDGRFYVVTDPVNYRSGSYGLSKDERDALAELAETLKANPEVKILVEGHADTDKVKAGAGYADNWELSTKRALRVVRELVKNGVNPDQVAAVGRGDSMTTGDGKDADRRTVVLPDPNLSTLKNN
ncbi:MAG: OmpA family protein, partial [Bacteroidota bacterium]